MLTEAEIRAVKAPDKPLKLFDGGGLYLLVNPNGSRWWRLKYRVAGREKLMSLGVYPDVPLKRAREKRDEARRMVADGIDPSAQRHAAKAAQRDSFEAIARGQLNPQSYLDGHDVYTFFEATGDLLKTGLTGTNVMDIRVILIV